MPGFDRTGPMGQGTMTGWGQGLCGTNDTVSRTGLGRGMGLGRRRGCGRGMGGRGVGLRRGMNLNAAAGNPNVSADAISRLQQQADAMQNSLDLIKKQIASAQVPPTQPDNSGDIDA